MSVRAETVSHPLRFALDFFFTDIMNHVEFLKWANRLDNKDDPVLLAILERLTCDDDNDDDNDDDSSSRSSSSSRSPGNVASLSTPTFYERVLSDAHPNFCHQSLPKNPLYVARVVADLKHLAHHTCNAYEAACLDEDRWTVVAAWAACVLQLSGIVVLLVVVGWNFCWRPRLSNASHQADSGVCGAQPLQDKSSWLLLGLFTMLSTLRLAVAARQRYHAAFQFNQIMNKFTADDKKRYYTMNALVNQYVMVVLVLLNVCLLLLSETPMQALLNGVLVALLADVDNQLALRWNPSELADLLASNTHDFIMQELEEEDLVVDRVVKANTIETQWSTKTSRYPYSDQDTWYTFVDEPQSTVVVFRSSHKANELSLEYEEIRYHIRGTRAQELIDAVKHFACTHRILDLHD